MNNIGYLLLTLLFFLFCQSCKKKEILKPNIVYTDLSPYTGQHIDSLDLNDDNAIDVRFGFLRDRILGCTTKTIYFYHCRPAMYDDSFHLLSLPFANRRTYTSLNYFENGTRGSSCREFNLLEGHPYFYLMLDINVGKDIYYGWIRFTPSSYIYEYAYNTVPNMKISPGQKE